MSRGTRFRNGSRTRGKAPHRAGNPQQPAALTGTMIERQGRASGGGKVKEIARDKQEGDGWQVASLPKSPKQYFPYNPCQSTFKSHKPYATIAPLSSHTPCLPSSCHPQTTSFLLSIMSDTFEYFASNIHSLNILPQSSG